VLLDLHGAGAPWLDALLSRRAPCDLVLIEGYKREGHSKIEVRRREAKDRTPLSADDPNIMAIAADFPVSDEMLPVFDLDDIKSIADFIERATGLAR
jgi:molybdopterin-guanine dinucleotide biosynthesis protein B